MTTQADQKKLEREQKNARRRRGLGLASWATALAAVFGFAGAYEIFGHTLSTTTTGSSVATTTTGQTQTTTSSGTFAGASSQSVVAGTSGSISGSRQGFGGGSASVSSSSTSGFDVGTRAS